MSNIFKTNAKVINFESKQRVNSSPKKIGINKNKEWSVRNINGKVHVDFMYIEKKSARISMFSVEY